MVTGFLSLNERAALTQAIFRVLKKWDVPERSMPNLLGLDPNLKTRDFNRYRLGAALPDNPRVYHRVARLLEIDNALHKFFPHSELSADLWVTTPRMKFGYITPLSLMLKEGEEGIAMVLRALYDQETW